MKKIAVLILTMAFFAGCSESKTSDAVVVTGLVDAVEIDVASKVPGRVKELFVREGDTVKLGDKLITIESEEIMAKIDQVTAAIDASKAKLKMAERGARAEEKEAAKKALDASNHQLEIAKKNFDRMKELRDKNALPQAKFDEAEYAVNAATDQVAISEARYSIILKGARSEEIDGLRALVKQGEGTLSEVQSYHKEMSQIAPVSGEISKIILHKGELAATGYPIITIVDLSDLWVSFSLREDMLKNVKKGMKISVFLPALDKNIDMEIYAISAMGDFATWKATTEKKSFDLKSFEVKARTLAPVEGIRPGMTARWGIK